MTPQPSPHRARRLPVRRSATLLAAALLVGGAPFVARALDDRAPEPTADDAFEPVPFGFTGPRPDAPRSVAPGPVAPLVDIPGDVSSAATPGESPEVALDPGLVRTLEVLTDTYDWDERSPRVELLQEELGVRVDGWYGHATRLAHRGALEFWELPVDTVPTPVLPPGPAPSQWAALRDCESGGDYAITNPSGRYRGAYQFDRPTWNSVAERHAPHLVGVDPAAASPAEQDAMAAALYSERGARPWPHCGRHLS